MDEKMTLRESLKPRVGPRLALLFCTTHGEPQRITEKRGRQGGFNFFRL